MILKRLYVIDLERMIIGILHLQIIVLVMVIFDGAQEVEKRVHAVRDLFVP